MSERQYVSFRMDGHLFGIDILYVREIIRNAAFTPVEKSLPAVRGLLNLRGQIITVIDPSIALGLEPREPGPESRCIILKSDDELASLIERDLIGAGVGSDALGLLVDDISDVAHAGSDGLDPPPAHINGPHASHLDGVLKLDTNLLLVLAPQDLIAACTDSRHQPRTVGA